MLEEQPTARGNETLVRLKDFIALNDLKPGQRLPAERQLIEQLGVSRNNLRKALDILEQSGTIWRHVGKGTFIAANGSEPDEANISKLVSLGRQLTPFKMMRARLAIEPAIAREAAINASGVAIRKMRVSMQRAHSAPNWRLYEAQDDAFHRAVAEATDNLLLLSLFDQLNMVRRAVAWGNVSRKSVKPPDTHPSFLQHEAIADAIANRDPSAAHESMRTHLRSVASRLFGEV